jgi:hypothetical protein
MKRLKEIWLYVFFLLFIIPVYAGQDHGKHGFTKQHRKNYYGEIMTCYKDTNAYKFTESPRDINMSTPELIGVNEINPEIIKKIETTIFTEKEITELNKPGRVNIMQCIVHTDGRIVSVSFDFNGIDPKIDLQKLARYREEIKELFKMKLTFSSKIVQDGYINWSSQVFPAKEIKYK